MATHNVEDNMKSDACAADAHALELTAWDVPSAIGAGERFLVAVGARCSAGCDLGGRELILANQEGSPAGTVKLGRALWPSTQALYFAEVEARAPLDAGAYEWQAKMAGWNGESAHTAGSFPVVVRVVAAPNCEVTVRAVDRENGKPIAGARVVMHPYRTTTDANGMAKVKVAGGQYDVLVSGSRYLQACTGIEVTAETADMVTRIELDAEPSIDEILE